MAKGLLIAFLVLGRVSMAQNLVPNPGFERQPPGMPEFWSFPEGACDHTMFGERGPRGAHTGLGYHGLCMFSVHHPSPDQSEYMTVELNEPLVAGRTYCLSMWTRVSTQFDTRPDKLDGVSWLFTGEPVDVLHHTRQSCSKEKYVDTEILFTLPLDRSRHHWIEHRIQYRADGTERYLTIGDFKPLSEKPAKDKEPKVKRNDQGFMGFDEYYVRVFFDDISITPAFEDGSCRQDSFLVSMDSVSLDSDMTVTDTLDVGEKVVLRNIYFDFDSASLKPESYPELDNLVALLKRFPTLTIKINGHTDEHGRPEYNVDLSHRRARAVVEYLVAQGIERSRLSWMGFGESQPISDDDAVNRRVEFEVVGL